MPEAKPSCEPKTSLCGVCNENKVFACTNETTIAFCYGENTPLKGAEVSYCLEDTVCDIKSEDGFCTERALVLPSCVTSSGSEGNGEETITKPSTETTTLAITAEQPVTTLLTTLKPTTNQPTTNPDSANTVSTSTRTTFTEATISTLQTEATIATTTRTDPTTKTTTTVPTLTTMQPTTATTTVQTIATTTLKPTTPSGPLDPDEVCRLNAKTGSFSAEDPTCTTFVVCYTRNGSIAGLKKRCPNNQYFSATDKICSFTKPVDCV